MSEAAWTLGNTIVGRRRELPRGADEVLRLPTADLGEIEPEPARL